jgi:hypothetical protein
MSFYTDKMGITYYNATITNQTNLAYDAVPAEFSQSFDNPIVEKTSDYDLCITRFNASAQSIPFWIVPIQLNQPNPNLTVYSVQTSYSSTPSLLFPQGNTYTGTNWFFLWSNRIVAPQNNGQPIIQQNLQNGYYFSYNVDDFVNMFNSALADAFNDTLTGFIATYPTDPNPPSPVGKVVNSDGTPNPNFPALSWNPSLNKFQMYFPVRLFTPSITRGGWSVFTNNLLYPFLQFPASNTSRQNNTTNFQITVSIHDNYYVPTLFNAYPDTEKQPYVILYSDHDTTGLFSPLHRVLIVSNSLPTSSEISQPASYPFQTVNPSTISNLVNSKIITDFEPDMYSTNQINRDFIQFNQSVNNSRLISLQNYKNPIDKIDIKVYWSDFNNNIYPLTLFAGCSFDLKIAFVPRIYITSPP